uniref:Uncharacterized protein n=1 Tax=Arundo donax TaxID=35708 RepID=A0A0A8Y939_ARUDO
MLKMRKVVHQITTQTQMSHNKLQEKNMPPGWHRSKLLLAMGSHTPIHEESMAQCLIVLISS